METKESRRTWGKHIGIPPRIDLGGLKWACKSLTRNVQTVTGIKKKKGYGTFSG